MLTTRTSRRVLLAVALLAAPATAASAQTPSAVAGVPACTTLTATLDATIDTKKVIAGDLFRFTTGATVTDAGRTIPAGSHGVGVISTLDHSRSQGHAGYLILDARYIALADGSHVPVAFVPAGDGQSQAFVRGGTSDAGILTAIPYYVGTAFGIYDVFHHGKDAAVLAGTQLPLVVGDGFFAGTCRTEIDQH